MGRPTIYYESGSTPQPWEAMTDDGDHRTFSTSFAPWSGSVDVATDIRPFGVATGGAVTVAASGSNNVVDVAALTAYMAGAAGADADGLVAVAASTDLTVTRASTDTHLISSITVTAAGALAVVAGSEGTSFSDTRGAAGGPPFIPVDSVEVAQVRLSSQTAAAVTASEIYQPGGVALERTDFPVFPTQNFAEGFITFSTALPLIHTGGLPKRIMARGAVPVFSEQPYATDWSPAETSYSTTSTETYDGPIGSSSSSLGDASFTVQNLRDGITDPIMGVVGSRIWLKFKPDRDKTPYSLTLGTLARSRSYPASGGFSADFTLSPEQASADFAS